MDKFLCKSCNGKGTMVNPNFEACLKEDNNWDVIKKNRGCGVWCEAYIVCNQGESIDCDVCDGNGYMIIDNDLWKRID